MAATAALPASEVGRDLEDLTERALLATVTETEALLREAEVHKLHLAYQWAVSHPAVDAAETTAGPSLPDVLTRPEPLGGPGTPPVAAFTSEPLAVALGCSPGAASSLLADALDLHHRLPLLWDHTQALVVPVWKARRIADRTRDLSADAARWVDRQLAGRASSLGRAALDRLVTEAAARCDAAPLQDRERAARDRWDVVLVHPDPRLGCGTSEIRATGDTLDLTRFHDVVCAEAEALGALGDADDLPARKAKALGVIADAQARLDLTSLLSSPDPAEREAARRAALDRRDAKIRLYLHASLADVVAGDQQATGSAEALGPVTLETIRDWAGRSRVTVQPVLHVAADDRWSVDRHDPPPRMAEEVRLRDERCVFPWCSRPARQCDLDHRVPHASGDTEDDDAPSLCPPGDPPASGATGTTPANLAPLCRRHHRVKTAGAWSYERVHAGSYLWTGPAGLSVMVTPRGTVNVPQA